MSIQALKTERRHSYRISVDGIALLWQGDRIAGRYRMADLSMGGCLLRDGPWCDDGPHYSIVLELDDRGPMHLPVRIVRRHRGVLGRHEIGVEFVAQEPTVEDRIQDMVVRYCERDVESRLRARPRSSMRVKRVP
ncbi:MAG TPA: PilZ domain-containing protein [Polyangiales bacterium]|nr:PilZ domain-containing protein [Polyangiales bacterium]